MREYIFTEREREMLVRWLNRKETHRHFKVLKYLIIKNAPQLRRDYEILTEALESFEE